MNQPGFRVARKTIVLLLFISISQGISFCQDAAVRSQVLQKELMAQLSNGSEEQRLDAASRLPGVFDASPNSASPETFDILSRTLRHDPSPVIRALLARAFETCCGQRAEPLLLEALLSEREIAVRKAIIYALARCPSSETISTLSSLLDDKKSEIRAAATYALAELGAHGTANELANVLRKRQKSEDAFARSQAARGLGRIGDPVSIDILLNSLQHDKSEEVRRESALAIGLIATKQDLKVIEILKIMEKESDPYLANAASTALTNINLRQP